MRFAYTFEAVWKFYAGDFYWGGYAGTFFWVDSKEQLRRDHQRRTQHHHRDDLERGGDALDQGPPPSRS